MTDFSPQHDGPDEDDDPNASSSASESPDYEPPRVEALGTLPESTGMPTSAQTFPPSPTP